MGDLGKRLARGEVAAFAELYDLCADRLHHYLVSQLGSRHDADEVLQETFLRLVRGREKLAGVESIAGYSFMIARNEALRRLAERANENRRRAGAAELFLEATHDDHEVREAAEELTMALARLRPEQREVVELKCYGGLTLAEIAAVTATPPGAVAAPLRATEAEAITAKPSDGSAARAIAHADAAKDDV